MKHAFFLLIFLSSSALGQNTNIDSLKNILPSAQKEDQVKVLLELCWQYRFLNADTARQYGLQGLELAKAGHWEVLEAEALNFIGVTHEAQGNYEQALGFELQALELRKKIGVDKKTAETLNNIGIIYDEKGDPQKSLEYYFEARKIFEQLHDSSRIAMVVSNIGIVLKAQKEYSKVVGHYHEALSIYKKLNNKFGIAACDANLGAVYYFLDRYDSALYYSLKGTKEFEEQNIRQFLASTLCNAGMAYDKLGNETSAREYLLKSQKLNEEYDNKKELAAVLIYIAGMDRKAGRISEGLSNAQHALSIAEKIGVREQIMEARLELAELKSASGDFKGAFKEHQLYMVAKDSLFQQEKTKQIAELQTKYETEKKENSIQLLTQENELKDSRLVRNEAITASLLILVAGLITVGYLWNNRTTLKQRAELEATKASLKEDQLQAVISSQEEERRRFAADLHDGMGQMISALRLNLSHDLVQKEKVDEAVGILNEMNVEIRKIAFNLMPQVLVNSGLTEALTEFANRINRTGMVQINIQAFDLKPTMPAVKKIALYRICQEWVNNILKYGSANKISIQLVQHENELVVTIEDNGNGFNKMSLISSQGNGWKNINSRLGLIKGNIEIDSTEGHSGTTVVISVPENSDV